MTRGLSISQLTSLPRVQAASARWIAAALALTAVAWLAVLAGLLAIAHRVHDDVPVMLAVKLPLLASKPELIFAGESRTVYQVDPSLAAQLTGKPPGSAINLGYDAGEDRGAWVPAPPLTASLDAVEALRRRFLPESQAHNKQSRLDGTWEAMVIDGERTIETSGITEAQARLAAILQAMAASPAR